MNSVLDLIYKQIKQRPSQPALHYLEDDAFVPITYHEMALGAERLTIYIQEHCEPGDNVVIWANNCWQWAITDLAIQLADAVSVPVYPTAGEDQLEYIFNDSKPVLIFVDSLTDARVDAVKAIDSVKKVISFEKIEGVQSQDLLTEFNDVMNALPEVAMINDPNWVKDRLNLPLTTLYTSGTTGIPKAVPLTHNNIVQNFLGILDIIPITSADTSLSFLPLSHIFERTVGFFCVMGVGASIYYAESIDTVARDLLVAKPTFIISVPRLYEKIYQRVMANATGIKKTILKLALFIGRFFQRGILWSIAYKLVFSKIHQKTGGNVRFLVTGGAPISTHIEMFFNAAGLPVVQGYGLTETSPIITGNLDKKVGSVGKPLDNLDVKILDGGEICVKGPSIFAGYSNVSNDDVFTEDGFFKTGDLGYLDKKGYLYVTGRKKEIIVLSNGKNISPNLVEEKLIQSSFVNQVVVVGDDRSYLVALVVPDEEALQLALGSSEQLADLINNDKTQDLIQADLLKLSAKLANFETIKAIHLLSDEFTIEGMELTPTLKLRRKEISKKYATIIESLYDKGE